MSADEAGRWFDQTSLCTQCGPVAEKPQKVNPHTKKKINKYINIFI